MLEEPLVELGGHPRSVLGQDRPLHPLHDALPRFEEVAVDDELHGLPREAEAVEEDGVGLHGEDVGRVDVTVEGRGERLLRGDLAGRDVRRVVLVGGEVDGQLPAGGEEGGEARPERLVPLDEVEGGVREDEVERLRRARRTRLSPARTSAPEPRRRRSCPASSPNGRARASRGLPSRSWSCRVSSPVPQPRSTTRIAGPRLHEVEEVEEGGASFAQELPVLHRVPRVCRHARDRSGRRTIRTARVCREEATPALRGQRLHGTARSSRPRSRGASR